MDERGPGYGATVSALAVGQILSWATLYYAFSSFVLPMQRELGWDKPTLMGAFTLGLAVWGAATYAAGAAIDAGHGRSVMAWGSAAAGAGFVAWSQVSAPWMLYAVWLVLGAAMACTLYEPAFNVLTKRYPLRYQHGITMLTLVGGFASTLSFPAIAALQAGLGWRPALAVIGGVLLLVAPLHAWALRGPALVASPHAADAQDDASLHEALRTGAFWGLTLCFMLHAFVQAALWAHVMPVFASKGVGEADALTVLMTVGPAQVAGRLLYVWLGRSWPLRRVGALVLTGLPVSMVLFALSRSMPALLLFALLFGMSNGLVTIVRGGLVPQYFGRTHVGRIGGAMSGIGLLSRAAAPLLTAWLLLAVPGYREVVLVLAAMGVVAVLAFWQSKPPQR
ncbi:MFS transporter [Ideonella sp. A 288]|uniref:MFS transporter n=1 Tax=Ideonella sp. A 288 TaxID=1962181 RepID=UPI0011854846|nr:MFS transporter [Ideonella sp. A 288]